VGIVAPEAAIGAGGLAGVGWALRNEIDLATVFVGVGEKG